MGSKIHRSGHEPHIEARTRREMQGNIAAIVDVSAIERCICCHRGQDFIGDRTSDSGHARDKSIPAQAADGAVHPTRDAQAGERRLRGHCLAQERQFRAQLIENRAEATSCGCVRGAHHLPSTIRRENQIDRPIVQMQPPLR